MAGGAFFDITITGKGSHDLRPEEGIDPMLTDRHPHDRTADYRLA
jgi:metal-dependent amidase/aminoacylase/carboxypeptidase family protein